MSNGIIKCVPLDYLQGSQQNNNNNASDVEDKELLRSSEQKLSFSCIENSQIETVHSKKRKRCEMDAEDDIDDPAPK